MKPAAKKLLAALENYFRDDADERAPSSLAAWYDQNNSPIHKRRFLEACRSGELRGRKLGKQWLVEHSEMDRYIRENGVENAPVQDVSPDAIDRELRDWDANVETSPASGRRRRRAT